jgi:hypothetical protein
VIYTGIGHTALHPTFDQREESGMRFSAALLVKRVADVR